MPNPKKTQLGHLPPKYNFVLNPYPNLPMRSCPFCEQKLGQRKLPLLIHIDPGQLIALNYTCRYCQNCDLLIANKNEIEHHLTELFRYQRPEMMGNPYLVCGTVEKSTWRQGLTEPRTVPEMLRCASDFRTYYAELLSTQPGWYSREQIPPVMKPPPPQEWVKRQ